MSGLPKYIVDANMKNGDSDRYEFRGPAAVIKKIKQLHIKKGFEEIYVDERGSLTDKAREGKCQLLTGQAIDSLESQAKDKQL